MNASNSISMFRGDVKTIVFALTITEADITRALTPSELTGVVIKFTAKRNVADSDAAAVVALSSAGASPGVVINTAASTATVTIPAASTANVAALGAALTYDLQISNTDGSNPHTFTVDTLAVDADVTRTA